MVEPVLERAGFGRIVGSSPVRQALVLLAMVFTILLTTLGIAYATLRASAEAAIHANLEQRAAGFQVAASPEAMQVLVGAEARAVDPGQRAIVYVAPGGRQTGNAKVVFDGGAIRLEPAPRGRPLGTDGYVPISMNVAGGLLVIAESRAQIAELGRTFLAILVFSFVPSLAVTAAYGGYSAWRTGRRVRAIETALETLTAGQLDARAEVSGRDDLARIAARLNTMATAHQDTFAALKQVSADIAHDLRTPLQRISALLQELAERLPEDSDEAGIAGEAGAQAETAVAVFQSLLEIARIDSGSPRARFTGLDLAETAAKIVDLYRPSVEEAGATLVFAPPGDPVRIRGDAGLIGQALSNLIENALRHAGPAPEIAVSVGAGETGAVLAVADDGPGIPEAERALVTRRLYRREQSRTTPGNGLGLALVAAVAAVHDGSLRISDNAPGTRVELEFPGAARG
ncbi:MAG: HAMP domain-containing histidine kinase [Maritimibacter sp.]|nr:HAMP domain-containing histidine kinase [Maritimibacter sp.]